MKLVSIYCNTTRPNLLQETIKCFQDQDYPNKEMIILNDNPQMTLKMKVVDQQITIFNERRVFTSMTDKAHFCIAECHGEYIGSMDDDNLYTPWRLSESVKYLEEHPEIDAVRCDWSLTSESNMKYEIRPNNFEDTAMWRGNFLRSHRYEEGKNISMSLIMESQAKMHLLNPVPLFWHIFRWGLGVAHLQGFKDELRAFEQTQKLRLLTNPCGEIYLTPLFFEDYWNEVNKLYDANNLIYSKQWTEKLRECLNTRRQIECTKQLA